MANQHSKKLRGLRQIDDDIWDDLGTATTGAGTDRSAISRRFYEWYLRRPGAKLPTRPEAGGGTAMPADPVANPGRTKAPEPDAEA
jgi:hypothetical protein